MREGNQNGVDGEEVNPFVLPKLELKISFHGILPMTNNFHASSLINCAGFDNIYKNILKEAREAET